MRAAGALEPRNDELQHLLDRAADVLGEGVPHTAAGVAGLTGPLVHEGTHVTWQVRQRPGALQAGELPEGDQQRNAPQHAPGTVAPFRQPGHVTLDLRADPHRPDPVDGVRLDEVLLQHGNFLSAHGLEEAASLRSKRYVN